MPQRTAGDARAPDHGAGGDDFLGVAVRDRDPLGGDIDDPRVEADLDSVGFERARRRGGGLLGHRGQQTIPAFDQNHPASGDIEILEFGSQSVHRELLDRTRDFDPGRTAADHHEGEPGRDFLDLAPDAHVLRLFEGLENPSAHGVRILQSLQTGRDRRPLVISEVAGGHPGGKDEVIKGYVEFARTHASFFDIESIDRGSQHRDVLLTGEHLPQRRGDRAVVEHARRQLVEQRLKERVVHSIDEDHVRVRASKRSHTTHAAEPTTDDHDIGAAFDVSDAAMEISVHGASRVSWHGLVGLSVIWARSSGHKQDFVLHHLI